jgi:hypothetical protein
MFGLSTTCRPGQHENTYDEEEEEEEEEDGQEEYRGSAGRRIP